MMQSVHTPSRTLDPLAPAGGIAVIAPHPDDEALGCGGLIALARDAGRAVTVVVVTDGGGSHPYSTQFSRDGIVRLRNRELRSGLSVLGLDEAAIVTLGFPDGRLGELSVEALEHAIVAALAHRDVQTLFATSADDPHPDHRRVYEASARAATRLGASLWRYPIRAPMVRDWLSKPDTLRLSIEAALERKTAAIACHASQLGTLITDDHTGFCMNRDDIEAHGRPYELFRSITTP